MPCFLTTVQDVWIEDPNHVEPYHVLHHKLKKLSSRLKTWSKSLFSNLKVQFHMALEVILRLDIAQESRYLSPEEIDLRKRLKRRVVGLAVLEKARKRQTSRITNIKEGDANTKFFHLRINRRRRKNFIHRLRHNAGWVTDHNHKKDIIHRHFSSVIKKGRRRLKYFNWSCIPTPD